MITLSADNLVKAYKGRKVVDRVSLEVNKGEIVMSSSAHKTSPSSGLTIPVII